MESHSAGNEETWTTLEVKILPEYASLLHFRGGGGGGRTVASYVAEVCTPPRRPDDIITISSRSVLSGPGNNGQRSAHLQSITYSTRAPGERGVALAAGA